MNIVFVVIDTLQYRAVAANGNPDMLTPNLDRLAARSWIFDRAFCASYPTIPQRTDLMTGQYGEPMHPWRPLRHDAVTFPRLLTEAGYATQLIHDTPHLVNGGHNFDWPFSGWTFIRGAEVDRPWVVDQVRWPDNWALDPLFDVLGEVDLSPRDIHTYVAAHRNRRGLADWSTMQLFAAAADLVRDNARRDNLFLWVDCFDPHEPWDVPSEFILKYDRTHGYDGRVDPRVLYSHREDPRLSPEASERIANMYRAKVTWVDHCAGLLLDALEETGMAQRTAVVLIADHGTNAGERNLFGKKGTVCDLVGQVPLFISAPGAGAGRCSALAQPQDLFATVAALAGMEVPAGLDGQDLLAVARGQSPATRAIALTGPSADGWLRRFEQDPAAILFTAFDSEYMLQVAMTPEHSRLTRLGDLAGDAVDAAGHTTRLHAAALDEVERRGAPSPLMAWLRSGGQKRVPGDCPLWTGWPGPAGYTQYWNNVYRGE